MEELDAKKVFTDTKDYPLSIIKEMFDDGDIIPQPDYQRDYIMDEKKASKLIESVLLRIPIPTVYLCEESDGTLSIIDGQQRLTSFVKFLNADKKYIPSDINTFKAILLVIIPNNKLKLLKITYINILVKIITYIY